MLAHGRQLTPSPNRGGLPVRLLGNVRGRDPVDGSAIMEARAMWEGRASVQPLDAQDIAAQGRAVQRVQRRVYLPRALLTLTGEALEIWTGAIWTRWEIYKVEDWDGYTLAYVERDGKPE